MLRCKDERPSYSDGMRALFLSLCLVVGCAPAPRVEAEDRRTVKWKESYSASECKALTEPTTYVDRCYGGDLEKGTFVGATACMPYSPPERMQGVWVVDLEHSAFFLGAATYAEVEGNSSTVWLQTELLPDASSSAQGAGMTAFAIDLIGRRSLCDFRYGHFGLSSQEVIPQRILRIRQLAMRRR